ncbi:MAG: CinA family protein [Bdellovibrionales bacterium]
MSMLTEQLQELFIQRKWTLAIAESCTGGLICSKLTRRAGSSAYFLGGVVSYANSVKSKSLQVPAEMIEKLGAVSGPVALAMAQNVRKSLGSSWSIGVTGIAGPTGGNAHKPVGTVWFAISGPECEVTDHQVFKGDREKVQDQAVEHALKLLLQNAK